MAQFARIATTGLVFLAGWIFSYWLIFIHIIPETLVPLDTLFALLTGGVGAWFIWQAQASGANGLFASIAAHAAIVGAIGFAGGFFGPIIFGFGGNQGPLLGLFITGPLGLLAGAVLGAIRWRLRRPG